MSTTKCCAKCKVVKPRTEFGLDPNRKDGNKSRCYECRREDYRTGPQRKRRMDGGPSRATPWTATELDLMHQRYRHGGVDACMAVMPNRKREAIYAQAYRLGLTEKIKPEPVYAVPQHEYTDEDFAMRAWRYPVQGFAVGARI